MATIQYPGPPNRVDTLAQMLKAEGLEVSYDPPLEGPEPGPELVHVVLFVADQVEDAAHVDSALAQAAIAKFKEQFPEAVAELDDDEGD